MKAYLIVRIEIDDVTLLKKYQSIAPGIIEKYHGKFVVRGGFCETLEGPKRTPRIVVIEFPSVTEAQAYYHSEEYAEARKLRRGIGEFEIVCAEGLEK